jgi:hypothetical protein
MWDSDEHLVVVIVDDFPGELSWSFCGWSMHPDGRVCDTNQLPGQKVSLDTVRSVFQYVMKET